ncbi:MAG: hypothetical protein ACLTHX_11750 [Blautia massiliensis (ex Durand et al. 2017)]|uniref:hypothetical protein n=1 Tax=Blautia massiliensis (ex Durand et al. 2017) TaxID=1737424 RepID=UPI00399106D7
MLTPVTQHWSSIQLHDELSRSTHLCIKITAKPKSAESACCISGRSFYLIFPTEKGDRSAQSPFLNMF